jgi:hypothetical protein
MPWWFETWDSKFSGEVFLARDEWVRVAEFNAAGYCRTFMDGAEVNCSN